MIDPWMRGRPAEAADAASRPRVLSATYERPVRAYLLDGVVWTRWMHYDTTHGTTVPCSRTPDCTYCPDPTVRVNGYLAAFDPGANRPGILYASDCALTDLERISRDHPEMRGLLLEVVRKDRRRHAAMHLRFLSLIDPRSLPATFDPRPLLERMWGFHATKLIPQDAGARPPKAPRKPRQQRGR